MATQQYHARVLAGHWCVVLVLWSHSLSHPLFFATSTMCKAFSSHCSILTILSSFPITSSFTSSYLPWQHLRSAHAPQFSSWSLFSSLVPRPFPPPVFGKCRLCQKLAWRREQGNEASSKAARQNPEQKVRVRGKGGNTPRSEARKETAMSQ